MELTVAGLTKTFRKRGHEVRALAGIDLTVGPGIFGLLGPNGAGKSTLMSIVATLQRPEGGSVRFGEVDALAEPQRMRSLLGYLPQEFGVYPGASAEALLDHLARLKGVADAGQRRTQVGDLLALVNLDADKHRAVDSYSGGMRQRFGVAQALLGDPRLLIVDEPTAGLDPVERNRFHRVLAGIAERVAIILSTHIVEDVSNLARTMAILDRGTIRAAGAPADLLRPLAGQMWQALVDQADLAALGARGRVVSVRMREGRTLLVIQAAGYPGEPFTAKEPDLEDVYFLAVPQDIEA